MIIPTTAQRLAARMPNGNRPIVMRQRWESLLFLHWQVPPDLIQKTLPNGLFVDTFNGAAYLGIVPFFMQHVRPVWFFSVPYLSFFQELNVRTYVHSADGTPGVWFYSLDCNQPVAVWIARTFFHLPYFNAAMSALRPKATNAVTQYACTRQGTTQTATFSYGSVGDSRESNVESLEFFLLERYYLYAHDAKRNALFRGQVSHTPYRYRACKVEELSVVPAVLDGFSISGRPIHQCVSDDVDVKIYAVEKLFA